MFSLMDLNNLRGRNINFLQRFPLEAEVLFHSNTYNPRVYVLSTKTEMRNETQGNVTLFSKSAYSSTI